MNRVIAIGISTLILMVLNSGSAFATVSVSDIQHDWAVANYELKGDEQTKAFEILIEQADTATMETPESADLWIWNGIVKSTYAGVKGGLGALSLAKGSRKSLETAMTIDDTAMNGSAYTSLGTLYYKVPGWPVGFGSKKKAEKLLKRAIEIDPDGIDSNYFYAGFLQHKKQYAEAEQYFIKAQSASPRPDRPLADVGRQREISLALDAVREKLN